MKLKRLRKAIFVVFLCLLMLGYLAHNLWMMPVLEITLIRLTALFGIIMLLVVGMPDRGIGLPILVIGMVALMGGPTSGISLGILFLCLTVLALRKLPVEFLASSSAYVLGITVALSLLFVYIGVLVSEEDVVSNPLELGGDIRSRMTFGYRNVNAFGGLVSGFCLLLMMAGKQTIARYAIALVVTYVIYVYTDSRAMILAVLSFIAFTAIFLLIRKSSRFLIALSVFTLITPVMLTILASEVMSNAPLLDFVLSGRLTFVSLFFSEIPAYRFLLGGAEPADGITVDNSFALLSGAIGIPLLIYVSYITFQRVIRCINEGDFRTYSFLLAFWSYSFTESSMLRPESIVCIVFWVLILRPEPVITHGKY